MDLVQYTCSVSKPKLHIHVRLSYTINIHSTSCGGLPGQALARSVCVTTDNLQLCIHARSIGQIIIDNRVNDESMAKSNASLPPSHGSLAAGLHLACGQIVPMVTAPLLPAPVLDCVQNVSLCQCQSQCIWPHVRQRYTCDRSLLPPSKWTCTHTYVRLGQIVCTDAPFTCTW